MIRVALFAALLLSTPQLLLAQKSPVNPMRVGDSYILTGDLDRSGTGSGYIEPGPGFPLVTCYVSSGDSEIWWIVTQALFDRNDTQPVCSLSVNPDTGIFHLAITNARTFDKFMIIARWPAMG